MVVISAIFAMTEKSHLPNLDALFGYLEAKYDNDYFILNCGPGFYHSTHKISVSFDQNLRPGAQFCNVCHDGKSYFPKSDIISGYLEAKYH